MKRLVSIAFLVAGTLALAAPARAQKAVFVVRHAEKISDADERLSAAGHERAARLAAMLKDAGITAVYSTDTERTRDTVGPLAKARKLSIRIYDIGGGPGTKIDARPLVAKIRRENPDDFVLVVGHSNTVPAILAALGCPGEITIAPAEYDNLFVVVPKGKGIATLVRLRY
jgi:broad specificity phosphatase PhoE